MKVAYLSDIHLETRPGLAMAILEGHLHKLEDLGFPSTIDAEMLVVAGDVHPNPAVQRVFLRALKDTYPEKAVVFAPGNHDFYGSAFPSNITGSIAQIGGLKVAVATLWTHLNVFEEMIAPEFMDFRQITGVTPLIWNQTHLMQAEFLRQARADIIVTHHTPSSRSSHPRFAGHAFNGFFTNNLDMGLFEGCKLWVHGHVHDEWDYVQDGVRVVCNPFGYPMEAHRKGAQVKIVEV
jgi:UDP-2,3-diacylglucosamine pyrophosphatase LpxH